MGNKIKQKGEDVFFFSMPHDCRMKMFREPARPRLKVITEKKHKLIIIKVQHKLSETWPLYGNLQHTKLPFNQHLYET